MAMTVKKSSDVVAPTRFISNNGKVADSPMGISIKASELVNGSTLLDGNVVAVPSSGLCSVIKSAKALTGSTTTSVKVLTLGNQFVVGDIVGSETGGIAQAITVITSDTATGIDTMTIGVAIGDPLAGDGFIYQMAAVAAATTSALSGVPYGVTGTNKYVDTTTNMDMDVWVIAAVKVGEIGQELLDALLSNNKYIAEV